MTIYVLTEAMYRGAKASVFRTLSEAKKALRLAYKESLRQTGAQEGGNCYCTSINALVQTEFQEDFWYGVIEKHEV